MVSEGQASLRRAEVMEDCRASEEWEDLDVSVMWK
jgi:hypothetical protein